MKLWRISQDKNENYDTYDSAVVAAETEQEAKAMHPDGDGDVRRFISTWVDSPQDVTCGYLGEAKPGTGQGVICSSFNAG